MNNSNIKMEILKTSQLIKVMHEDDEDFDVHNFDYLIELDILFNMFASNKILNINLESTKTFLQTCKIMHRKELFKKFKPPAVEEYFCKELNYLLLIDFIISFNKIENPTFDVKNITTKSIFEFFVKLGDFFNFMNFLDVDESFTKYLKTMLTLYLLQLDRDVIEKHFGNIIPILDSHFANDFMIKVFKEVRFDNFFDLSDIIKKYQEKFKEELKDYNQNIVYAEQCSEDLNKYFTIDDKHTWDYIKVNVKQISVEVPNPRPAPIQNFNNNNNDSDSDSDSDNSYDSYDSYDDMYGVDHYDDYRRHWTPTILKKVDIITDKDENFEKYRKQFILMKYQMKLNEYKLLESRIRNICKNLKIKEYTDFIGVEENFVNDKDIIGSIHKIKVILGFNYTFDKNVKKIQKDLFKYACEYGNINVAKNFIDTYKDKINKNNNSTLREIIEYAAASPNRSIMQHLMDSIPDVRQTLDKSNAGNYYIQFNIEK